MEITCVVTIVFCIYIILPSLFFFRLKERFEIRREHYNRFLQEQEDELLRVEKETAERKVRQQHEEEEKQKQETEVKRSSLQSGLHYSYYAPMGFLSLHEVRHLT